MSKSYPRAWAAAVAVLMLAPSTALASNDGIQGLTSAAQNQAKKENPNELRSPTQQPSVPTRPPKNLGAKKGLTEKQRKAIQGTLTKPTAATSP